MSGQLRTIKNRIRSVENTKKITHAMEMVAAAKLRRFQDMMVKARPYTQGLEELVARLLQDQLVQLTHQKNKSKEPLTLHPFFEQREEKKIALLLFTSDTGLCGSYNTELIEKAKQFIEEHKTKNPLLIGMGKFGVTALKRFGMPLSSSFQDLRVSRVEEILKGLKSILETIFLDKKVDAVYVLYSHFQTLSVCKATFEKLLPFKPPAEPEKDSPHPSLPPQSGGRIQVGGEDYIYEPNPQLIFEKLIPVFFEAKIRMIFLESFVSEQIARMTAMRQATDNAEEMVESLVLVRNKARQASITKEIIEIISGSRALKIK